MMDRNHIQPMENLIPSRENKRNMWGYFYVLWGKELKGWWEEGNRDIYGLKLSRLFDQYDFKGMCLHLRVNTWKIDIEL